MGNETAEVIETTEVEEEVVVGEEVETEVEAEVAEGEVKPVETEEEAEEGEFVVSIGEESLPQEESDHKNPNLVKDLRKVIKDDKKGKREDAKKIRELSERLESYEKKPDIELGEKPTLESCEYDEGQLETELDSYYGRKNQIDKKKVEAKETEEAINKAWQGTLDEYEVKKTALKAKVNDFDEAEALVKESLSVVYQGAILQGSKDPALLMLALGKNPQKLKELSSIKDPAKFIWAVATMESQLKTGTRKATTTPEKKVVGTGSGNSTDSTLAKLEEEADKSGDRSKVIAYKQKQKQT
jgi:hypothetical protein